MASLASLLDEPARAYPDQVALCFRGREFTYREMCRRIHALAGALAELGVGKGGFAAVIAANSNVTVEVLFACAHLGAVCERYNVRLSPRVIARLLARSEARVVFVSAALRAALAEALGEVGRPLTIVDIDGGEGAAAVGGAGTEHGGVLRYEELLASAGPVPSVCDVDDGDPAMLLYTSGTTGLPRGVLLSHGALTRRVAIDIAGMRFSHDDILLCELPLFHVTFVSTLATLALGARLVIADSHKPADIAADIVRTGATRTALVPCLMRGLADYVAQEGIELATLELIIYGGEPVEPELLEHCRRLLPCGFLQGYGMTETTAAITMLLPEHHEHARLLPTVGKAVPGMEIRIADDEGRACAAGVPGEVLVRTDTLMLGYYRDPVRTAEAVRDGWYRTGDIGVLDAEGFLTLVDRKNNLVISGGENVYPLEVSRCIKALAGVADAVVAGVPDKQWGESLAAFVVRAEGSRISEADIVAHCARELGGYKKPQAVRFVDDLGRSASGKVPRERLEELKRLL
ncbi:class I adenylate-forming enzyme family protein [Gordonibacter sp. RACS_AR68]|uniref:class I adenylate-forming enzyme family protein n=1 Tax=Gordonibacter sp. RACS_AR68 TaxID=2872005 RepID=UPI00262D9D8A|nr:AMP-binding protein [Gordonibacter sp. RACS_AR68]MDN4469776.1 AMP-binding protein [Gordonibacter sp. RACS_AR68]